MPLKSKEHNTKKVKYLTSQRLIYLTVQRKRFGLTQEQVAELFNVSRSVIIGFESGRNERTDILFKYIFNFVPEEDRKTVLNEYIEANLN